jgi:hypothetical protein
VDVAHDEHVHPGAPGHGQDVAIVELVLLARVPLEAKVLLDRVSAPIWGSERHGFRRIVPASTIAGAAAAA